MRRGGGGRSECVRARVGARVLRVCRARARAQPPPPPPTHTHMRAQLLTSKLGELEKKYGLGDREKVREAAVFEMYKAHIKDLRTAVEEDVAKVSELVGGRG